MVAANILLKIVTWLDVRFSSQRRHADSAGLVADSWCVLAELIAAVHWSLYNEDDEQYNCSLLAFDSSSKSFRRRHAWNFRCVCLYCACDMTHVHTTRRSKQSFRCFTRLATSSWKPLEKCSRRLLFHFLLRASRRKAFFHNFFWGT